jgi:hypothetical protein
MERGGGGNLTNMNERGNKEGVDAGLKVEAARRGWPTYLEDGEKGAVLKTLAWRTWGASTKREDMMAQAQVVKVATANTTATSDLAADGGHTTPAAQMAEGGEGEPQTSL